MIDWLTQTELFNNPLPLWLYAAATGLITYVLVHGGLSYALVLVRRRQERTPNRLRAIIVALLRATQGWLIFLLALVLAAGILHLEPVVERLLGHLSFALVGLQIALWANALIKLWLQHSPGDPGEAPTNPIMLGMLVWTAQLVVWTVLLLAFLANVGINVTTFVASLGIGGIAVALALQNVLGDLFSSIAIGLDKPFEVGQFIAFSNVLGTVVHVGVKTTRIDSLSGEQLVISNSNLLKELVHNYSRMPHRRISFAFRLPYDTAPEAVEHIVAQVRTFVEAAQPTRFDRAHLANFGEYGLEFEAVYYVLTSDYTIYRNVHQQISLNIMKLLASMNLKFAVPVRMLGTMPGTALQLDPALSAVSGEARVHPAGEAVSSAS